MARIEITKPVRGELLDELLARGIAPTNAAGESILRLKPDRSGGWLEVPDAQAATAQQVIDAHDAGAIDAAQAARDDRRRQDRVLILAYAKMTTTPTAGQTLAFQRALARDHLRVLGELKDEDA